MSVGPGSPNVTPRSPGARPISEESGASGAEPPRQRPGTDASVEPSARVGHSTRGRWMGGALGSVPMLSQRPAVLEDDPDADPDDCGEGSDGNEGEQKQPQPPALRSSL
jgi:hypothetical protein